MKLTRVALCDIFPFKQQFTEHKRHDGLNTRENYSSCERSNKNK